MAVKSNVTGQPAVASRNWYPRSPDKVSLTLDVDPAVGLTEVIQKCHSE